MVHLVTSVIAFFRHFFIYFLLFAAISCLIHIVPKYMTLSTRQAIAFYRTRTLNKKMKTYRDNKNRLSLEYIRLSALDIFLSAFSLDEEALLMLREKKQDYGHQVPIIGMSILLHGIKYLIMMLVLGRMLIVYQRKTDEDIVEETKYSSGYTLSDNWYFLERKKITVLTIMVIMDVLLFFVLRSFYEHYIFMSSTVIMDARSFAFRLGRILSYHIIGLWIYVIFLFSLMSALVDELKFSSIFKHGFIVLLKYPTDNLPIIAAIVLQWVIAPGAFFLFTVDVQTNGIASLLSQNVKEVMIIVFSAFLTFVVFGAIMNLIVHQKNVKL